MQLTAADFSLGVGFLGVKGFNWIAYCRLPDEDYFLERKATVRGRDHNRGNNKGNGDPCYPRFSLV